LQEHGQTSSRKSVQDTEETNISTPRWWLWQW